MSATTLAKASIALLPRLGGATLVALLAVTIGTNLLDFAMIPAAGQRPGVAFAISAAIRVILVFWISFVVQRRIVDQRAGLGVGAGFWRFVLLQLLFLVGMVAVRAAVLKIAPPAPTLAGEWLANFIGLAVWGVIAIRLLAWNAALAVGAPFRELAVLWRGLKGQNAALIGVFVMIVLPPAALHLAFTLIGLRVHVAPGPLAFLSIADGLVSALQLALNCAVAAVALRLATNAQAR